jgi:hypothetical protein
MSWLALRKTTRTEDMAYCMLGLFDVNMPLLYGEGAKAFIRLQMEIINTNDDESIFAWNLQNARGQPYSPHDTGMLATSAYQFANLSYVERYAEGEQPIDRLPYAMTNQGLRFEVNVHRSQLALLTRGKSGTPFHSKLNCYQQLPGCLKQSIELVLNKTVSGPSKQWKRTKCIYETLNTAKLQARKEEVPLAFYIRQSAI